MAKKDAKKDFSQHGQPDWMKKEEDKKYNTEKRAREKNDKQIRDALEKIRKNIEKK
jgi:hypothetical protein